MRGVRRGCLVLLAVVVGSGPLLAAAPSHAQATHLARAVSGDAGSDWGDGASATTASGRVVAKAARTTTVNPASGPDFEMPFSCGQTWTGSSRPGHSPSYYAIDWNSANDLGKPVVASAPGVVVTVRSLTTSYGRYVVVDNGNGFSTLYAHMSKLVATVGEYVDQGDLIGYVGSTGNSTGPHLHFEERLNGAYFPPYFHRATFRINSTLTSTNCDDYPVTGDWNGDGTTDVGVYRDSASAGTFYERVGSTLTALPWGKPGDVPVAGDFDGDGSAQAGVRREDGGAWYLRSASGAVATVSGVGVASDIPITGDWDGNGRANLGYFRPSTDMFYLRSDSGGYTTVHMGTPGSRPIVGDWNGDGKDDLGVLQATGGKYTLRVPEGSTNRYVSIGWGYSSDIPFTGDWNHDGRSELGLWRPSTAQVVLRTAADVTGPYVNQVSVLGNHR